MVDLVFTSWNRIADWLKQVEGLQNPVAARAYTAMG